MLGYNPIGNLLQQHGLLHTLPAHNVAVLTGKQFFPHLISGPFHHGLMIVFTAAVVMSIAGAAVSFMRGRPAAGEEPAGTAEPAGSVLDDVQIAAAE
jgi:hypothetical protein